MPRWPSWSKSATPSRSWGSSLVDLAALADLLREALGRRLVGAWVHGSIAMGCFRAGRSDIDVLVVVDEPLDPGRRQELARRLLELALPGALELSVLTAEAAGAGSQPFPFELHVGSGRMVEDSGGGDVDLAAHLTAVLARGRTLQGPPPADVLGPVPWADFLDAICDDLEWGFEHASILSAVLNACRVLQTLDSPEGTVVSKEEGAAWGLDHLPAEHRPFTAALTARVEGTDVDLDVDSEPVRRFRAFAVGDAGRRQSARKVAGLPRPIDQQA